MEELKTANPDFPAVSSGIYVQEVVPNSPSQRYVPQAEAGLLAVRHGGGEGVLGPGLGFLTDLM